TGEITYGLERLAMYVQSVDNGFDLDFNGADGADAMTYGDVFHQNEVEMSAYNFELADTDVLFRQFEEAEKACLATVEAGRAKGVSYALPAYDQCVKASHLFNLLDARGVISVAERQNYILRVRTLSKACCEAWLESPQGRTEGAGVVDYAG
ncbi:MAG: glycine--tRNA ligase subunit alpha, partial [Pseudomonadota bacterium]